MPRTPRRGQPFTIVAADGFKLGARLFPPEGPALGTVIIHGATAVPQRFYEPLASWLQSRSLRVVTYDFRGVGESRPPSLRGLDADFDDWAVLDARAAHREVRALAGGAWPAAIGHSFGGHLLGLVDELREISGMALVGSGLPYYGHWPTPIDRARLQVIWRALVPAFTGVFGYLPGAAGLGSDLPAGVARQWARWCTRPEYFMDDHPEARARFARFDRPLLVYSFTDDQYAPEPAVKHLMRSLTAAPIDHLRIDPSDLGARTVGHFGFFRRAAETTLWPGLLRFLESVITGQKPVVESPQPWSPPTADEVMRDLQFGR